VIAPVLIAFAAFGPAQTSILSGDTVTWTNEAVRAHTVDSLSGAGFDSPQLLLGDGFSHAFAQPGAYPYYCRLHPFMHGEVDVYDTLLDAPTAAAGAGRPFVLRGRTAQPAGSTLTIVADDGSTAATTTVGADGTFSAAVTPSITTSYHAPEGNVVTVQVLNRTVRANAVRHGRTVAISADVAPAAPGGTVVLQLKLKERFGWWPVQTAKLDGASHVRFRLPRSRAAIARVVLTQSDGATRLAVSPVLRVKAAPPAG
jgi:hypothetical protein